MKKVIKKGTIRSKIKRGDQVVFVAGKEYNRYDSSGKRNPASGRVIAVDPRAHKVKVEGAMIIKKHQKANPQINQEGGILKREAWVNVSNVAIMDPKTGEATRIGYEIRDGKKVRISRKSGSVIPEPGIFKKQGAEEDETAAPAEKTEETVEEKAKEVTEEKAEAPKKPKKKAAKKVKKDKEE